MYRLIRHENGKGSCEHCGHGLKSLFTIANEDGEQMVVGSECVRHFLAADQQQTVALIERRVKRAGTQWRKQTPPRKPGETRAQYINRRLAEMDNARRAGIAWAQKFRGQSIHLMAQADLEERGLHMPKSSRFEMYWRHTSNGAVNEKHGHAGHYAKCERCAEIAALQDAWSEVLLYNRVQEIIDEHAAEHSANPYDFNRPFWEVRKI